MPFPQMGPGAARPPRSPLDAALEALMAQAPEPESPMQPVTPGFPSPPEAPETGFGQVKPIQNFFDQRSGMEPPMDTSALERGFPGLGAVATKPWDELDLSSLQRPSRMGTPGLAELQALGEHEPMQVSRHGTPGGADRQPVSQPSRMGTPGAADREPFGGVPDFWNPDADVARGDALPPDPPPSPFAGVTRENAMQGLAGLQSAQENQFSPFGEGELSRLANRDPNMVAPGSNQMWAGKLQEMQGNRLRSEDMQRKALEGISGAIQGTHPAVQFQAEQEARRKAMPAQITAQGQVRAAQEAANSRRDVGEANLEGRDITARHNTLDTVMQAIRAIRAKQGGLQGDDAVQLRALENLYDLLSEDLGAGGTFGEATEGFEDQ